MYRFAVSLLLLLGLAADAGAQDLLIEQDGAGGLAGRQESLDAGFRAALDDDGSPVGCWTAMHLTTSTEAR